MVQNRINSEVDWELVLVRACIPLPCFVSNRGVPCLDLIFIAMITLYRVVIAYALKINIYMGLQKMRTYLADLAKHILISSS